MNQSLFEIGDEVEAIKSEFIADRHIGLRFKIRSITNVDFPELSGMPTYVPDGSYVKFSNQVYLREAAVKLYNPSPSRLEKFNETVLSRNVLDI